jgi:HPt (histidine-containing phosphotransfer) domain-containing protein
LLLTFVNEDIIKEVAKTVLEDVPQSLELLTKAIKAEDSKDIRHYAHKLKGTARHVGAAQLSEKVGSLERVEDEKDINTAASLIGEIQTECEKLVSFLSQPE